MALAGAACWLIVLFAHDRQHAHWQANGRLGWSLTVFAAAALVARGVFLGRPVTVLHAAAAAVLVLTGVGTHVLSLDVLGEVLIASSGLALMWPTKARCRPEDLHRVWRLITATKADPLAPFAMQTGKCYYFDPDRTAALAYRTRGGYAVVSGDPIGDEACFPELVANFAAMCRARGWRIVVLACSERRVPLWTDPVLRGHFLRPIPIGRDIIIDVASFDLVGRKFRNLRQAVSRSRNFGITTEIVDEQELDDQQLAELTDVVRKSARGAHADRGFCMNLDGVLEGRYPGVQLVIGRDRGGQVQGFHRYASAGAGSDISLDVPWRRRGAPNGLDERLSVDMILAAKAVGAQRVSLAFAAFPEIFGDEQRGRLQHVFFVLIHLLDPLISLESLYRYLRKFHAMGDRRYVLVRLTQIVPLLLVLLSLEFMPRRRRHR